MIYRVNIIPTDPGHPGVILDAHCYDPKTMVMGAAHETITLANVHSNAPIEKFIEAAYRILERIGCPNPPLAEIEDMR